MDTRRCTSEKCLLTANRKSLINLDLPVATILTNPKRDWQTMSQGNVRIASQRKIDVDWNVYNQSDYLFTHCSIVSSVQTAENGFYIEPPCDELVNANGNAWSTPVLLATFKSFIGGDNFVEHVQVKELSKGRILDAIARPVHYIGKDGHSSADIFYVDILVATDRRHTDLIAKIESGQLSTLSMGCIAVFVTCSQCGKEIDDSMKNCWHLDNNLLRYFKDANGKTRVCAELCGRMMRNQTTGKMEGDPNSVKFIEASWVEKPAFKGAVVNHFISDIHSKAANVLSFDSGRLQDAVDDIFRLRVADTEGALALRVARQEIMRRRRIELVNKIAKEM